MITGAKLEKDIVISVHVSEELVKYVLESEQEVDACHITVEMTPVVTLEEVQVAICPEESFVAVPQLFFYSILSEKELAQFLIYCRKDINVHSLQIGVIITFTTNTGIPKVSQYNVRLPFKFVSKTCTPQKEALHKIVINISEHSIPLNTLFTGTCEFFVIIYIKLI